MKQNNLLRLTITGLLVIGVSGSMLAAERGDRRGDKRKDNGDIDAQIDRIFSHYDTDDNGGISFDEYLVPKLAKAEEKFNRLDTDNVDPEVEGGDGLLTLEEILAAHAERERPEGDSEIDREAVRQCVADRLDIDPPVRMTAEERFDAVDTNDDGFIDFDEYTASKVAAADDKFNRLDADMDGEISKEEMKTALESRKESREVIKECREEQELINSI